MKIWDKLLIVWGSLDILSLVSYSVKCIIDNNIPIINDLNLISKNLDSFGLISLKYIAPVVVGVLYISLGISGYFLIKRQKVGIILAYVQTPFRLIAIMPPSISIFLWCLGTRGKLIVLTLSIITTVEVFKVYSLYKYQKTI
jgi:hypothetical protein